MHIVPFIFVPFAVGFVVLIVGLLAGVIAPLFIPADRETRRQIGVRLPQDHD